MLVTSRVSSTTSFLTENLSIMAALSLGSVAVSSSCLSLWLFLDSSFLLFLSDLLSTDSIMFAYNSNMFTELLIEKYWNIMLKIFRVRRRW